MENLSIEAWIAIVVGITDVILFVLALFMDEKWKIMKIIIRTIASIIGVLAIVAIIVILLVKSKSTTQEIKKENETKKDTMGKLAPNLNENKEVEKEKSDNENETTNFSNIAENVYKIFFKNQTMGYIKLPKEIKTFCVYQQDDEKGKPETCIFLDNLIPRETFLNELGSYINICKTKNKILIIGSDDGKNDWKANTKIKFGKEVDNLHSLQIVSLWHPIDQKTYRTIGKVDY